MSLEIAAKHLAAQGRGPDTQLVHMSKNEVNSLRQLAKQHGGTLTVNPKTGLPEAGFLDSIMPTVIGAAAVATMGPAALPYVAGGVGALQYARTGSLAKGLTAGLGAYGGGSLASGFMGAGATAAGDAAAMGAYGAGAGVTDATAQAAGFSSAEEMMQIQAAQASAAKTAGMSNWDKLSGGVSGLQSSAGRDAFMAQMGGGKDLAKTGLMAAAPIIADQMVQTRTQAPVVKDSSPGQQYTYAANPVKNAQGQTPAPDVPSYESGMGSNFGKEQVYFDPAYTPITQEQAKTVYPRYANGGPIEEMSTANAVGANTGYPMADISQPAYAVPFQTPMSQNVVAGAQDVAIDPYTGQEQRTVPAPVARFAEGGDTDNNAPMRKALNWINPETFPMMPPEMLKTVESWKDQYSPLAQQKQEPRIKFDPTSQTYVDTATGMPVTNMARGGLSAAASHLGDYSDGGRLLKGPGDGVSDSIPATIGNKRPARLADGEFVVPARIVSELGNGSTEAGARKLYAMLDRVQAARKKSIGKGKVAKNSRADKLLPA